MAAPGPAWQPAAPSMEAPALPHGSPRTGVSLGYSSRCTVSGAKAGRQTAMYSAPSAPGVL